MIINIPTIQFDDNNVVLKSLIESKNSKKELWFSVPRMYKDYIVARSEPFLLALLLDAMKNNEDIHIKGPLSTKLFFNISCFYLDIIKKCYPHYHKIRITVDILDKGVKQNINGVATGFSGGVDSFTVLGDHYFDQQKTPDEFKINHLIYNNVGPLEVRDNNNKQFNRLIGFSEKYNLPYIKIDSNVYEFSNIDFVKSHTVKNIAAIYVLQNRISKFYYASSFKYEDIKIITDDGMGPMDPLALNLLSSENLTCLLSGAQYPRTEKLVIISQIPDSYQYLDVCADHNRDTETNCSVCFKCCRTLLTLDILNLAHLYKDVFDIEKFKKVKQAYIEQIFYRKSIYDQEIIELIKNNNYQISMIRKIFASKPLYLTKDQLRKVYHRIKDK